MISIKNIYFTLNKMLKGEFPTVDLPDKKTKEGYQKPSFFISISPMQSNSTVNYRNSGYEVQITYRENDTISEITAIDLYENIKDLFKRGFMIKDKDENRLAWATVEDYDYDYDGTDYDIPTYSFRMNYREKNNEDSTKYDVMESLDTVIVF